MGTEWIARFAAAATNGCEGFPSLLSDADVELLGFRDGAMVAVGALEAAGVDVSALESAFVDAAVRTFRSHYCGVSTVDVVAALEAGVSPDRMRVDRQRASDRAYWAGRRADAARVAASA